LQTTPGVTGATENRKPEKKIGGPERRPTG
jgi:hypothetical protein